MQKIESMHLNAAWFTVFFTLFGSTAYAGSAPAALKTQGIASIHNTPTPTDRMIIKYRTNLLNTKMPARSPERAALHSIAFTVASQTGHQMKLRRVGALGVHVMQLDRRTPLAEVNQMAKSIMAADPNVEYAEPDRILWPQFIPNDIQYGQQWHYFESTGGINLPAAWDKATGTGVVVAVIDTGYRPHADLAANILPGYDFIDDAANANDGDGRDDDASDPGDSGGYSSSSWHGTHVAGTIAAITNNGIGVAGIAYNAKILPVRILGTQGGYTSDIADAIVWASGGSVDGVPANPNPARVMNMSFGGGGSCDNTFQNAIDSARSRGSVSVVAAGNSNSNVANFSPASCNGVVAVAATNRSGGRTFYSNYGSRITVAAPGGETGSSKANGVLSTLNSGTNKPGADAYDYYQGTSMAAPHVAGVVALMLSKNPSLSPDQVAAGLKASARAFPTTCSQCGSGLVDASAAIDIASNGDIPIPPPPPVVNEVEPNDTFDTAQAVTQGVTVQGTIASNTDKDYFKVSVAAGATLNAVLIPNDASDYDLYVYDSAGKEVGRSATALGIDEVAVKNSGSSAISYYVQIRYYSGGTGGTNGLYSLSMDYVF